MSSFAKSLSLGDLDFSEDAFALEVVVGLSATPKYLPPKYLYDERGSHLFQEITQLKEYYPTRCELEIMKSQAGKIRSTIGSGPIRLLELGAGDGEKTKVLIEEFLRGGEVEYIPIDISKEMIAEVVHIFEERFHASPIRVTGIASDYVSALRWLHHQPEMSTLILFLGSSIGNFETEKLFPFLLEVWNALRVKDWALIGFDLKKEIPLLDAAYDDPQGVTQEFNLNLLDRLNREFGGNFKRDSFYHHVFYNPAQGRMESWLISREAQTITLKKLNKEFQFAPFEGIHVESSYKYTLAQVQAYGESAGFQEIANYLDSKGYFLESLWQKI